MQKFAEYSADFDLIAKTVADIKEMHYIDNEAYISQIANKKIEIKAGEINPLEMILSLNCNIKLYVSVIPNAPSDKKLKSTLHNFLNNTTQSIYLLLGKSGSGKSLFLRTYFAKLSRLAHDSAYNPISATGTNASTSSLILTGATTTRRVFARKFSLTCRNWGRAKSSFCCWTGSTNLGRERKTFWISSESKRTKSYWGP